MCSIWNPSQKRDKSARSQVRPHAFIRAVSPMSSFAEILQGRKELCEFIRFTESQRKHIESIV